MRQYLQDFMVSYDYPGEAVETLLSAYGVLKEVPAFQALIAVYEKDRFCDYTAMLATCKQIAAEVQIHTYTVEFLMFMCFSRKLRETYLENGYSEALWRQSMLDLKCKMLVCWDVKRIWGMFVAWWYDGFFRMERFGLGRMEFELFPFPLDYYEKDGKVLRKGDTVINCHIPRTGEPLTPEMVQDAMTQAVEFYKDTFAGKPIPIFCESWLIYSKMDDLLPAKSNIRSFKERCEILHDHLYDAGDYSEMWRLYDMDFTGNLDDFPADSTLRKNYRQFLKEGGQVGEGYGVFFW